MKKTIFTTVLVAVMCTILCACLVACSGNDGGNQQSGSSESGLKNFEGLTFASETVTYDGREHQLTVKNLPADASVVYTSNKGMDIGEYNATATVSKEGYATKTLSAKLVILPSANMVVTSRENAKNANEQNYDFYINLAGTVDALGITETANANYDGKYRFNTATGDLKFRRETSGILLVDSTEYIYTQNDAKIKVVANERGEVKKASVLPKEDEGLYLINIPFVALVNGLKEDNITKIELSGVAGYKYVATLALQSDNKAVASLLGKIEKLGTKVNLKDVSFTNPMSVKMYFNLDGAQKLVDFKMSADVSFPVKGVSATIKLTYLQKENNATINIPSIQGLIIGKDAIKNEMDIVNKAIEDLKNSSAYSVDLEARNEFDPAWNINATVDKYIARMYKNTDADTGRVDFNHSFEYKAHTDTDDKDTFKFTVGNVKTGEVYRISRKGTNTNTLLEGVSADGQFDYLTSIAKADYTNIDCIKKVEKDGSVFYYIYLDKTATHDVQKRITDVINSNPTDNVTDVQNYFNEDNQIDEAEMVVEMKDGALVAIDIKTQLRYCPTGGEHTERNIVLTNTISLTVNGKLSAAQNYVAPDAVSTTLGHYGLNNAKFYIL